MVREENHRSLGSILRQWRSYPAGKGIIVVGILAVLAITFIAVELVDLYRNLDSQQNSRDLFWLPSRMDRELGLLAEEAALTLAKKPSHDVPVTMRIDFVNSRLEDILNANFGSQRYLKAVDGFDAYVNRLQALTAYMQDIKGRLNPPVLEELIHKVAVERERSEAFSNQTRLMEQQFNEDREQRIQQTTRTIMLLLVIAIGLLLMVCIILHIEARRFRAQLLQQQQENVARNTVLAGISHEFRSPLQSIATNVRIIAKSLPLGNSATKAVQRLNASMLHLESIIDGMIDQAAICSEQLTLTSEPTDLQHVVNQVVDALTYRAEQRGISLLTDLRHIRHIMSDEKRLRQILWNLASNGVKYTDTGSVTINVEIQIDSDPLLILTVKDTGVGIPSNFLKRVQEPFQQGPNKRGGTGLGLWIVKSLVEAMGGHINIHSLVDNGTTVTVFIPVQLAASSYIAGIQSVLLVDNDPAIRQSLQEMLLQLGMRCQCASSESEAKSMMDNNQFDAIICDSDLDTANIYDETKVSRPFAIITTSAHDSHQPETVTQPFSARLNKPISESQLKETLAQLQ
ncbi:hybrid sensor histidine kinase/response regulator [Chitinivorax sp. B]|uniref:ATP-binding response regulator n=1 Tax=Chitinivorax sp. B TaxID=2502235 RepID=UPI0010F63BC4|nr:hybrid sensor histidine kinase/response regulator [Chitinivorax sp. B]